MKRYNFFDRKKYHAERNLFISEAPLKADVLHSYCINIEDQIKHENVGTHRRSYTPKSSLSVCLFPCFNLLLQRKLAQ